MDKPVVVMMLRDGLGTILTDTEKVTFVPLNLDELAEASRGALCRAYKQVWGLPEDIRPEPLDAVIQLVGSRFPIMGEFRPGLAGIPVAFNATEAVLIQGPDYIDNLRDPHYPADDLANNLLERRTHDGPFEVEVDRDAALEFLYSDENEAEAARLNEPDEAT